MSVTDKTIGLVTLVVSSIVVGVLTSFNEGLAWFFGGMSVLSWLWVLK